MNTYIRFQGVHVMKILEQYCLDNGLLKDGEEIPHFKFFEHGEEIESLEVRAKVEDGLRRWGPQEVGPRVGPRRDTVPWDLDAHAHQDKELHAAVRSADEVRNERVRRARQMMFSPGGPSATPQEVIAVLEGRE